MQPRLSLETDPAGAHLRLDLHPCPEGCDGLEIGTRDGARRLHAPLVRKGDRRAGAVVPLAALLDDAPLRWDVRLVDAQGGPVPLRPQPSRDRPRHFFRAAAQLARSADASARGKALPLAGTSVRFASRSGSVPPSFSMPCAAISSSHISTI